MTNSSINHYIVKDSFGSKDIVLAIVLITVCVFFYLQYSFFDRYLILVYNIIFHYITELIKIYQVEFICKNLCIFTLRKIPYLRSQQFFFIIDFNFIIIFIKYSGYDNRFCFNGNSTHSHFNNFGCILELVMDQVVFRFFQCNVKKSI